MPRQRRHLCEHAAELLPDARVDQDEAANIWIVLPGARPGRVIAGSHLDCVPDGGWLDGCLGVLAALEPAGRIRERPDEEDLAAGIEALCSRWCRRWRSGSQSLQEDQSEDHSELADRACGAGHAVFWCSLQRSLGRFVQ